MQIIAYLLLFCALVFIAAEDFKHLAVRWLVFPVLFMACILLCYLQQKNLQETIVFTGINSCIVLIEYGCIALYVYLKEQTTRFINTKIGLGDFLFLFAITPLFHPLLFLFFEITGLITTLTVLALFRKLNVPVPLAGYLSVVLIICIIFTILVPFNTYNPTVIFRLLP